MSTPDDNKSNSGFRTNNSSKKKKIKKKKDRKIRLKERLRSKPVISSFTNDFLNNFCKVHGIPVFQEKWHFKPKDN